MGKTYKKGKTTCKKLSDGSEVCIPEEAWSVFYGFLAKHQKADTQKWSTGFAGFSDENLVIEHAKLHAEFNKIGDDACRKHFAVANELMMRGYAHANRSPCDLAVEMADNLADPVVAVQLDEDTLLRNKWKACRAMMFRLNQGMKFETKQFSGLEIDEQKHMVKSLARKIRHEMHRRGWKPTKRVKAK